MNKVDKLVGEHLAEGVAEVLHWSDEERIEYILRDRWVGYSRANEIIDKLEDLLRHPRTNRVKHMLLVAKTNNGKSHIANHFQGMHPATENPTGNGIRVPVLLIQAPDGADLDHFYRKILDALFVPYKPNVKASFLYDQVVKVLNKIDLGIIMIDEFHNMIIGTPSQQRLFLNSIKNLGNEVKRPIVGIGTQEALRAIQIDEQISNRFHPEKLPSWKLDMEFRKLMTSLEAVLPLKNPSGLDGKLLATRIYGLSEGTIGEISTLINEAAIWAIRNTKPGEPECITEAALISCGYEPPSSRKTAAQRL